MLRVVDLMQRDVQTIDEDAMVSDAILLLADGHVGGLPVLNGHRRLVGIISTTDILSAEAESGGGEALNRVATHARVGDLMTPHPKTIAPDGYEVKQIFTIGGTYDYIPHTYPPMVSALFNHEDLREEVIQAGFGLTEYTGPISIHTFIL